MAFLAQGVPIQSYFKPATTFPTVGDLVDILVKNVFVIAGVLLFVVLIFGGLQFIISAGGGDKEGVGKGKNALSAAIVGFVLIFAAYWIVQIIETITGIDIFKPGV